MRSAIASTPCFAFAARFLPAANLTNAWTSRFAGIAFWRPGLRVLCYHMIGPAQSGRYTVTAGQFDSQLAYLVRSGFRFITARDLLSSAALPERPILLTFDDGYADSLECALPILRRHHAKATVFVVSGYAGDRARWNDDRPRLMAPDRLRELDPELMELALHSHSHRAFATLSMSEIEDDVRKNIEFFGAHGLRFTPALAYPYGSRPKRAMGELGRLLGRLGISLAFRVGNRVNRLPLGNPYEIQRLDVNGEATDLTFRRKLWIGRVI